MLKSIITPLLWGTAAVLCIIALSVQTQAAQFSMGPGDHYDAQGNIVALDGTLLVTADGTIAENEYTESILNAEASRHGGRTAEGTAAEIRQLNYTVSVSEGTEYYLFEGKTYTKSSLYGNCRLTGYSEENCGTAVTFSGKQAQERHTVAASSGLPIGTVIIIEGTEGPYAAAYNGMYVVEDRGGQKIENEDLIDIFFKSAEESGRVTASGWNRADVWVAEPTA
ncbi:MAG: hypothetical protein Q4D40_06875 [Eubacteriales bacterium]|nr:hypothetical protein [Eubacteriales bacterium]